MSEVSEKVLKQREYKRIWTARNAEKERERQRRVKESKRSSGREAYNAYMREWREKNKDRINAANRERRKSDKEYAEKVREADRHRHKEYPDRHRNTNLKMLYGITLEEYDLMYLKQNGRCFICNTSLPDRGKNCLVVDHCHNKGHVRGLLCGKCNTGIGQFRDNVDYLKKAIEYLERR